MGRGKDGRGKEGAVQKRMRPDDFTEKEEDDEEAGF